MRLISHPILCNYYVTYRCNASCGFCDIWEKPSPYIDPADFERNLKDLKRLGVKVIDFTGGEPLLHREIEYMLKRAKKERFITTLTTNCLLYPKKAEAISGLVDMLHFSLDSSEKEKHDVGRGVACFDSVLESIRIARRLKERPDILFTVFNDNLHEIDQIYQTICIPYNLVLILNPFFEYNQVAGQSLTSESIEQLSQWGKRKHVYLNKAFLRLREAGGNKTSDPVCRAASSTMVISPANRLVLPCYHAGLKEFSLDEGLYKVYYSEEVQKLVQLEGRLPVCEGCVINCYMQPSFAVEMNKYWFAALGSTLKYNRMKGTWKNLF